MQESSNWKQKDKVLHNP